MSSDSSARSSSKVTVHRALDPKITFPKIGSRNCSRLQDWLAFPVLGHWCFARGLWGLLGGSFRRHQFGCHPRQACHYPTQGHSIGSSSPWWTILNGFKSLIERHWIEECIFVSFETALFEFVDLVQNKELLSFFCLHKNLFRLSPFHKKILIQTNWEIMLDQPKWVIWPRTIVALVSCQAPYSLWFFWMSNLALCSTGIPFSKFDKNDD